MTSLRYAGKERYQSSDTARVYDQRRFSSVKGKLTDWREKSAIIRSLQKARISGGLALDVPCGTGRMTELLLDRGFHVVAADISDAMMKQAIQKTERFGEQVQFTKADVENLQFHDNTFDVILTIRLLHHIPPELHSKVLKELHRVTRRWVIMTFSSIYSLQHIRRNLIAYFTKFPRYSIRPSFFRREVDQAGFDIVGYIPMLPVVSESVTVLLQKRT